MARPRATDDITIRETAIYWVARVRSGECSNTEREALSIWLCQDESHRQEYQKIQDWLTRMRQSAPDTFSEMENARRFRATSRPRLRVIATSLVFMLMGGFWVAIDSQSGETYRTGKGERISFCMSDGTQITLNTDTELVLRTSWFSRRVNLLRGEALFTVAHDTGKSFEVIAVGGTIRDLGTRFDVHREDNVVSVTVLEGSVEVWTDQERDARLLGANDQISYDASGGITPIVKADAESVTAWSVGRILFRRTPLPKIFSEVARYHDVRIDVADERVNTIEVNGTFRIDDVDGLFRAIETLLPVRFERLPGRDGTRMYQAFYQAKDPAGQMK